MIKIFTVIGARPQIIKAAALSRAIQNGFSNQISEVIVHTGQHYDANMSQVFFDQLSVPVPDFNLQTGSDTHGRQTADMIVKIEALLIEQTPHFVVLYGDTNSTLAGSVAASKLHIPIIHIEAGLRSFNKTMPEEINRIVCDHTSTLLFSPTKTGLNNLIREGFKVHAKLPFTADNPGIFHCGDVMYDNSLYFSQIADEKSNVLENNRLVENEFVLATIHRDNNTDNPERLNSIFEALHEISADIDIVLPLHPRTNKVLEKNLERNLYKEIVGNNRFKLLPPASFFDMMMLEKNCKLVLTDSGGVQKEAYFFQKPVIILRPQTEWVEIVENGCGKVTDSDKVAIINTFNHFSNKSELEYPAIFGDGKAGEYICKVILGNN